MAAATDPRVPIISSDLELKAFIRDIRTFPESHEELMDLNSKVKEKITELRLRIQDLEEMGKEQDKESERLAMLSEAEGYRKRLLRDQTTWRKANLACRTAIDRRQQEELLGASDVPLRPRKMTKVGVAQTAGHMTECLMSVTRMMSQQVKMSEETIGTLAASSRILTETNEEFKSMTGALHSGANLLSSYSQQELIDGLLILLALVLFLATVLYILKKRLTPLL
ncbi:vesicle transport protein SEC20 [Brienomyrus brachyistius]|uniref:vesicle transport protein SEC20 n=1 Tax=Brienomyrus brachyistius TaxID=42636 RepID=UPI0020B2645D|nr:vesicle transport protein SEC20 [Brienomyrus brachyistius]